MKKSIPSLTQEKASLASFSSNLQGVGLMIGRAFVYILGTCSNSFSKIFLRIRQFAQKFFHLNATAHPQVVKKKSVVNTQSPAKEESSSKPTEIFEKTLSPKNDKPFIPEKNNEVEKSVIQKQEIQTLSAIAPAPKVVDKVNVVNEKEIPAQPVKPVVEITQVVAPLSLSTQSEISLPPPVINESEIPKKDVEIAKTLAPVSISLQSEKSLPPPVINESEIPKKAEKLEEPAKITHFPKPKVSSPPTLVNVPDDGNCLFYSICIGLRKQYFKDETIQRKLQWNVDPAQLTGNLRNPPDHLNMKIAATSLREQAFTWLTLKQKDDETVRQAIFSGIQDHNESVQHKIADLESSIAFYDFEIQELNQDPITLRQKTDIKAKEEQIQGKTKDLLALKETIFKTEDGSVLTEENIQKYLALSRENFFYGSLPHIYAISQLYDIPLKIRSIALVTKNNQTSLIESEQTYNEKMDQSGMTSNPLTLVFKNKHYQYLEG